MASSADAISRQNLFILPPNGFKSLRLLGFIRVGGEAQLGTRDYSSRHFNPKHHSDTSFRYFGGFVLEFGDGFFVDVPFFEDGEDGFRSEASAHEVAEDAGGLLLVSIFWLLQALAANVVAGEAFFFYFFVGGGNGFVDDVSVDSFGPEVIDDAGAAKFLVIAAVGGKGGGVFGVVEIALVFEADDDEFDEGFADFGVSFDTVAQQALEFGDRAHAAAERSDGVFVEFGLGEELFGTSEAHEYTIRPEWGCALAESDHGG